MAGAESYRGAQEDPEKRKYPGGAFDPMGAPPTAAPAVQHNFIVCTECSLPPCHSFYPILTTL